MTAPNHSLPPSPGAPAAKDYCFWFVSELLRRPLCIGKIRDRIGRLSDIVCKLAEPYPEVVGILLSHGWGQPAEFIPWPKILRIEEDALFLRPPDSPPAATAHGFPAFVDQPGWILLNQHLMGRTIFDMDGRRTEVVNDVHLLHSQGRMILVHVDVSFNGFWRRWSLGRFLHTADRFINWRYVQPFSLEDAVNKDAVSLSITRRQIKELPPEDLADTLEELRGQEQEALFSALEPETAAEALAEAEPRTQRQLIADLRQERARKILTAMSLAQIADLLAVLPHDDAQRMLNLLPAAQLKRVQTLLSEREATAEAMLNNEFIAMGRQTSVGEALAALRACGRSHDAISYIYVTNPEDQSILGVVDLRELVLTPDPRTLGEIMAAPVVCAQADDTRDDLTELFLKYHFRMIPVVDARDRLLGVIHSSDIIKSLAERGRIA